MPGHSRKGVWGIGGRSGLTFKERAVWRGTISFWWNSNVLKICFGGTSQVVQRLRLRLPLQRVQVWSLVREQRSHKLQGQKRKNNHHKTEAYCNKFNKDFLKIYLKKSPLGSVCRWTDFGMEGKGLHGPSEELPRKQGLVQSGMAEVGPRKRWEAENPGWMGGKRVCWCPLYDHWAAEPATGLSQKRFKVLAS